MFNQILTNTYYGNTVQQWLIALLIVAGAIIVGKIVYFIFGNVIKKLTEKTKTKLDDIIVDMIEEPIVFALMIVAVWFALKQLVLPEGFLTFVDNTYHVLIVFNVAWLITRLLNAIYKEYVVRMMEESENKIDDHLFPILKKVSNGVVWVLALIVGLNNAGYDVGALLAGLGIGGLAIAMASKDTLTNILGGFTILVDKPFHTNDRIRVSGYDGMVKEIGLRSIRVQTLDGTMVTIPNSSCANSPIENVSLEPSRKVSTVLGLTYDTKPAQMEKAIEILKDIIEKNEHTNKKVIAGFEEFADSSMNIRFIYYIKKGADIVKTKSEINMEILTRFNKARLDFAFPTQTIYTKKSY